MEIVKLNVQMNAVHGTHCERYISYVNKIILLKSNTIFYFCVSL